jgi:dihydroanticapsin dehydrogenase
LTRFEGQTVLLIGGATGIGRATAERVHDEGAAVIIADVNHEDGEDLAIELNGQFVYCDVTHSEDMWSLSQAVRSSTVIYTAGVQVAGHTSSIGQSDLLRMFAVNTFGVVAAARYFGETLQREGGSLTIVASVAGLTSGGPGLSVYGAAKGAAIAFTKSAAIELAPARVNCVCPGWTDTPFNAPVVEFMGGPFRLSEEILQTVPLQREAQPEEIAAAVVFVASDDASYMTGATLVVDGGLSI